MDGGQTGIARGDAVVAFDLQKLRNRLMRSAFKSAICNRSMPRRVSRAVN